jgi:hypothetical protein
MLALWLLLACVPAGKLGYFVATAAAAKKAAFLCEQKN